MPLLLAYSFGIAWLATWSTLPVWPYFLIVPLSVLAYFSKYFSNYFPKHAPQLHVITLCLLACCLGLAWGGFRGEAQLKKRVSAAQEQQSNRVLATVMDLPKTNAWGTRLSLLIRPINQQALTPQFKPMLILANDYTLTNVWPVGSQWQVSLSLKAPHGQKNGVGFDREAWLFSEGYSGTGNIQKGRIQHEDDAGLISQINRVRAALLEKIHHTLGKTREANLLAALTIGAQNEVDAADWLTFANTGTTHLVSISGLHITLLASLLAYLFTLIYRYAPSSHLLPIAPKRVIASIALLGAVIYAALAGFSVPTQRALFMLIGLWAGLMWGRNTSMPFLMSLALALVLTLDPFAVLAAGFWLSFGLVAALFAFLSPQLRPSTGIRAFFQSQWIATLVSVMPLLYFFGQLPLVSPVANAISIPLVSALITPVALLGLIDPSGYLLQLAAWLAQFLFFILDHLAQVPVFTQVKFPIPLLLLALLGSLLLGFPRGTHLKISGLLCLLPLLLFKPARPEAGVAWVRVLDVGQGLAVLIETKNHTLLFDTGAQAAHQVLLPQLQALGYQNLDALVLSHHDNDHDGAAESLLAQLPVQRIYAGQPAAYQGLSATRPIQHCHQQLAWQWDSVNFRFLTPTLDTPLKETDDNARSCVLHIQTPSTAALLTGDLPAQEESRLLTEAISAEVFIVGHHGSKTSSSLDFLRAVNPKMAVVSAGYLNRYRHPHPSILQRLSQENIPLWRTDKTGQILFKLDDTVHIETEAEKSPRYWRP